MNLYDWAVKDLELKSSTSISAKQAPHVYAHPNNPAIVFAVGQNMENFGNTIRVLDFWERAKEDVQWYNDQNLGPAAC